ncbi:TetR/AcrR family transcriptional regulator [Sinomicrobium weinanense]|uniref:TetR/AcrR family transcriptional regulator n=1 Tax=Sinomicrobium weinanense TaxID=2842200 RepID=A0A926Q365_9FLAO|nr:TetR/AcrR family transcriptional regulator [Sinomicrobium weinanense]MBC9797243.1 TetR/AcrR family transcriptional regulator [Sinomicrobium weinanense]MBU3122355.1 TetR/AcrR family transcriptional regulator [Sinomicrobium weinanense]
MKKAGVKERIITTASDLFYHNGYNQTGINQIIAEADVAKASMYQHFRSKEDIAVAYLQKRHISWIDDLTAFLSKEETAKGKLTACFDYLLQWLKEVEYRGCGFQNIICDLPEDHQKIKDQVKLHKNEVKKLICRLLKDTGEYQEANVEQLGDQLMVVMEGAIILSQIQKDSWPVIAAKKTAMKLLT